MTPEEIQAEIDKRLAEQAPRPSAPQDPTSEVEREIKARLQEEIAADAQAAPEETSQLVEGIGYAKAALEAMPSEIRNLVGFSGIVALRNVLSGVVKRSPQLGAAAIVLKNAMELYESPKQRMLLEIALTGPANDWPRTEPLESRQPSPPTVERIENITDRYTPESREGKTWTQFWNEVDNSSLKWTQQWKEQDDAEQQ